MQHRRSRGKAWKDFHLGRTTGVRGEPKKRILIVCEGEKTEPNYFRAFRVTSATIVVKGLGIQTKNLVNAAIDLKNKASTNDKSYDETWVVLDRDSFNAKDFREALQLASENGIEVAYSNEAFEIWYLLHYSYFHTAITRNLYAEKLSKQMRHIYKKNSTSMYEELLEKQPQALKYAKKLLNSYSKHDPCNDNPCTTVFKLVEELNRNL